MAGRADRGQGISRLCGDEMGRAMGGERRLVPQASRVSGMGNKAGLTSLSDFLTHTYKLARQRDGKRDGRTHYSFHEHGRAGNRDRRIEVHEPDVESPLHHTHSGLMVAKRSKRVAE